MSDLLEALKDTNRLIGVILNTIIGPSQRETLKETRARAALLTDRIIEASRQAGAVWVKDQTDAVVNGCTVERLTKAMNYALNELEHPDYSTSTRADAIRILKAGMEGGAA
jgi:hypothetical protein